MVVAAGLNEVGGKVLTSAVVDLVSCAVKVLGSEVCAAVDGVVVAKLPGVEAAQAAHTKGLSSLQSSNSQAG